MAFVRSCARALSPLALLAFLPALTGCEASMEAYMGSEAGLGTTEFNPLGQQIHCVVFLKGGDESTRLQFFLTVPPSGAVPPPTLNLAEVFPRPTSNELGDPIELDVFLLTTDPADPTKVQADGPWPSGRYTMKVVLDDVETDTLIQEEELPFDVK